MRFVSLLPRRSDYAGLNRSWRHDLFAGLTVGIVALPLALAFGVSSGVGAASGIVTAVIAGLVAAIFGGSNVQVSGPTGAMVVVLAPIVATHGADVVGVLCLMAGAIVVLAGTLKLGRAVAFIPWPVIEGFTLGIAIIIFLQQIPASVAVRSAHHSTNAFVAAVEAVIGSLSTQQAQSAMLWSLGTVVVTAAIIVVWDRVVRVIPGSFVAIVLVTVATNLLGVKLVTIGSLPVGLPIPRMPSLDISHLLDLVAPAFAIAMLAAIESLLSARVASDMKTPEKKSTGAYNPDRELFGQGLASIAAGFFGGMPATGAIARTAVNVRSGARTRVAAITHSVVLLAIVLFASTIVSSISLATLAAVLMVTAVRMIPRRSIARILHSTRGDALILIATAFITVAFDLIDAVFIGIIATAFFSLRALAKSSGVHREELPAPHRAGDERIALLRLEGALFFGAADSILERVSRIDDVEVVILRLSSLEYLDASGAHVLVDIVNALEQRGITVLVKGIRLEHADVMRNVGVIESLRHEKHLFTDLDAAVAHARSHVERLDSTRNLGK